MSTLVTRIRVKNVVGYFAVAAFCILFMVIYEKFSYGQYSWYMRMSFAFPLLGGAVAAIILLNKRICVWSLRLWNSAIAVSVCGCLVHGVTRISGRGSNYDMYYWIAGGVLAIAACIVNILSLKNKDSGMGKKIYGRKEGYSDGKIDT